MARRPARRMPRDASCASGRTQSATRTTSPTPASGMPPHGLLAGFPNLKAIINLGAGVDHLLADPALPPVPVARVAHADLTMRVTEYVVLHVLMHHRRQRLYDAQQRERLWRAHDQPAASEVAVGVMGLGVIGSDAAAALARLGFKVAGWSRTPKTLAGRRDLPRRGRPRRLPGANRNPGLPAAAHARHRGHLESRAVPQAQARWRGRRRVPDQRRAGPVAGRCRHR